MKRFIALVLAIVIILPFLAIIGKVTTFAANDATAVEKADTTKSAAALILSNNKGLGRVGGDMVVTEYSVSKTNVNEALMQWDFPYMGKSKTCGTYETIGLSTIIYAGYDSKLTYNLFLADNYSLLYRYKTNWSETFYFNPTLSYDKGYKYTTDVENPGGFKDTVCSFTTDTAGLKSISSMAKAEQFLKFISFSENESVSSTDTEKIYYPSCLGSNSSDLIKLHFIFATNEESCIIEWFGKSYDITSFVEDEVDSSKYPLLSAVSSRFSQSIAETRVNNAEESENLLTTQRIKLLQQDSCVFLQFLYKLHYLAHEGVVTEKFEPTEVSHYLTDDECGSMSANVAQAYVKAYSSYLSSNLENDTANYKGDPSAFDVVVGPEDSNISLTEDNDILEEIRVNANTSVEKIGTIEAVNITQKVLALNYSSYVDYAKAVCYGYTPKVSTIGSVDVTSISYSGFLEGILDGISSIYTSAMNYLGDDVNGNLNQLFYFSKVDTVNNMAAFSSLFKSIYVLDNYAESYLSDDSIKAINEFLTANKDVVDKTNVEIPDNIKQFIKTCCSVHYGLEALGFVNNGMLYISKFDEVYNLVSAYEDNTGLSEYSPSLDSEPMSAFFDIQDRLLSTDYQTGVALSSSYVPMQTSTYDPNSLSVLDSYDFLNDFHYKYGFHRKALYIDTEPNCAISMYVTGMKGSARKIAKLSDLLNPEKDIVLYVDDNCYNVDQIATLQGFYYDKLQNSEDSATTSNIFESFSKVFRLSIENIAKTAGCIKYDDTLESKVLQFGKDKSMFGLDVLDTAILPREEIIAELASDEYSALQSYAVVSAVYRHNALYQNLQTTAVDQSPVFVSSPTLYNVSGIERDEFNTVFNYAMVKNIPYNMGIDYKTKLDVDSPIFIDVYGNIVTESGIVIIPAASNATLMSSTEYNIYTAGFLSGYGRTWSIPSDGQNTETYLTKYFTKNEETEAWDLKPSAQIGSFYVTLRNISVSNRDVLNSFYELYLSNLGENSALLPFNDRVWLITEVLRGAPLENVDMSKEGIIPTSSSGKYGMYFAYKLEDLIQKLLPNSSSNFMLSLPNLAFMDGVEYVIAYGFKLLFAFLSICLMYNIYIDSIEHHLGFKTLGNFLIIVISFIAAFMTIPIVLNYSYYGANKLFLQEEAGFINILNTEKKSEGKEIGVYEVTAPASTTKMYLKIDDIDVKWYDSFGDILISNSMNTMNKVYEEAFENSPMAKLPHMERKANGIYLNIEDLFETSSITLYPKLNYLYQQVKEEPYSSYVTPYYYVLDSMISNINAYNLSKKNVAYATRIVGNGETKTVGMITDYLMSTTFMETGEDVTGLRELYLPETVLVNTSLDDSTKERIEASMWFNHANFSSKEKAKNVSDIEESARLFVIENKSLIGKVTDETFLRCLALHVSIVHNQEMKVPAARAYELMNIDPMDFIRVSLTNKGNMISSMSESFSRFVFNDGGTFAIICAALLVSIYFAGFVIKLVCMSIILCIMVYSMVVRKLFKSEDSKVLEGYLISTGLLCAINFLYALIIKLSILFPTTNASSSICIIVQILLQVVYLALLIFTTYLIVMDKDNMGFNRFAIFAGNIASITANNVSTTANEIRLDAKNAVEKLDKADGHDESGAYKTYKTGRDYLNEMRARDERRRHK